MQIPQDLIETAELKLKSVQSEAEFFQLRAQFLGKKSFVVSAFSRLRDLKSDEKVIAQFNLLQEKANGNGFVHYEISNFGKEEFFSSHNTAYWRNKHYLGIGPSAHSFNGISRSWNVSSNKEYISGLSNNSEYYKTEILSKKQQYNEYIFTSLRTIWGVDSEIIEERFGEEFHIHFLKELQKWKGKLHLLTEDNIFTLTQEGKAFADAIASDLFVV